jgi:recombinational DNA repair ATPase RecF
MVSDTRTKKDYANFMDCIVKDHFSDKEKIIVIQDNLNTHTKGSFYENLSTQRAGELNRLMEFQYTPKHASWLNMAEIEFSSISRQCLKKRIPDTETMKSEVYAWQEKRNLDSVKISWSYTTEIARDKMANKYVF